MKGYILFIIGVLSLHGCVTTGEIDKKQQIKNGILTNDENNKTSVDYKKPDQYNIRITVKDNSIVNPDSDRRCYYRVFVDKVEIGRTTTGLESQDKTLEVKLDPNKHLVQVEKFVLDEKKGKYEKLNNIEQPRPDYIYVDLPEDKIMNLLLEHNSLSQKSDYRIDFEKK
jgi:hypothetical protein